MVSERGMLEGALLADAARTLLAKIPEEEKNLIFARAVKRWIESTISDSYHVRDEFTKVVSAEMKVYLEDPDVQANIAKNVYEIADKMIAKIFAEMNKKVMTDLEYYLTGKRR